MPARRTSVAILTALAALALAACGGDLSAEELAEKADEICREGQQDFADIQSSTPANAAEAADQTEALLQVAERQRSELSDLDAPTDIEAEWSRYLDARSAGIATMRRGLRAARTGDRSGALKALERAAKQAGERRKLARAAGLEVCGGVARP